MSEIPTTHPVVLVGLASQHIRESIFSGTIRSLIERAWREGTFVSPYLLSSQPSGNDAVKAEVK
jgi:hypothetical protein